MSKRSWFSAAALAVVTFLVGALTTVLPARAEPLPATYSGSTHGDVLALGLNAAGIANVDASLAHSATSTNSTASPRTHAESANLDANAVGIPVGVASDQANSGPAAGSDSYTAGLGTINLPGILQVGAINGSGQTNWAGDLACVPDGTPLAQSRTSLANASLGLTLLGVGLNILQLGAVETSGNTTLSGGNVVSTSSGNVASLSLINGLVDVEVLENPTITATSDGATGSVSANDYAIAVTIAGQRTELRAGMSLPINLNLGVLSVNLTLSVGQLSDTSQGATGSGSTAFIELNGSINGPLGGNLASVNLGLLPLSASATAPQGGVECGALDPPTITSPSNGDETGTTPTITGTGTPGATVTVSEGDTEIGTATVDENGNWSLTPETPLPPGEHTIQAVQSAGDAVSPASEPVTFTVADTEPPDPPVITSPEDGSTIGNNTPEITGTGEPGATVTIRDGDTELGTATVDENGNWSFTPESPLSDGDHTITATQEDAAGNVSGPSEEVSFTVDTEAPDPPVITSPEDGSTIGNNTPVVEGRGEPGATVEVIVDGESVGEATVDDQGNWSFPLEEPLSDGEHVIEAIQTDPAGNASEPAQSTVTVDTGAPDPPAITSPEGGSTINDNTPEITGTGEPGATVTIRDGDTELGTATVDENGNWSFTPDTPLEDGPHTITATQEDAAGNVSGPSEDVLFTIDTVAPPAPVITSPGDGSTIGNPTPEITGTGEPGHQVTVSIDGVEVGTTTVGENGTWTLELDQPLGPGDHTATAIQTDDLNRDSPVSDPVSFTVEQRAVPAPEITSPESGSSTSDPTPVIEGTGEPGATVQVIVDGEQVGEATVDDQGNWRFELTEPLAPGNHTITATQTLDGVTSAESDPVIIVVEEEDTTPPDAPVVTNPQDGGQVDDRSPTVEGTGEPGATVEVVVDGESLGTVQVGADGTWAIDAPELGCGQHTLSATQTDAAGNVSEPTELSFTVVCDDGDGGAGNGDGGGAGDGDGGGGHDLITAPPVSVGPPPGGGSGFDGTGYDSVSGGKQGLAQTGAPLTVLLWLGLLALASGGFLLRRFRADR
ncbi:Ig-like domain-containing protein [Prauserella rugosa]|uniref:LPXTG-motif cell wall-anchored protein n=1 Tax=Prauserella rugosa TaxID=43354 RepID=A0A660CJK2_9PSEU|nr:Ig-like domain-containing protein [Prauserella rugosa]TWH21175.1 LPXTG-motif cell wall-anchored protein [Prauserella rugosa]